MALSLENASAVSPSCFKESVKRQPLTFKALGEYEMTADPVDFGESELSVEFLPTRIKKQKTTLEVLEAGIAEEEL